jgi:16S rRNA (cytosine1402-N4)-methyltransferase
MTDPRPDSHVPVMLERTIELLAPALQRPGAVMVDATLGLGGHAEAFLERFPDLTYIGLDRDQNALAHSAERLSPYSDRIKLVHSVYDRVGEVLEELHIRGIAGVLFDLGVSSMQLDRVERGFSYSKDAPLDMRMDDTSALTAERVLAEYDESELRRIFYQYGEEKLAPRYARRIVERRAATPLTTSAQLVALIDAATPAALRRAGHPAKRVFQALRIEVNQELASLERALPAALDALEVGGRIVVLAYQSLEDRIVKRELAARSASTAPRGLPVELPEHAPVFKLLVRGAELADDDERERNSRSAPVRLRAAEKLRSQKPRAA